MAKAPSRPYRLGIDVGSNSLGWFVVWLNGQGEPVELGPGGVRIYPDGRDPKSKESNAADRRVARGMRRRRDRYLKRRGNLMGLLVKHGLMPQDEAARKALEKLDPYELRAKALDETLPAPQIGRALFHLNQRRGFLSNRKTEKGDSESGAIKTAAGKLQQAMADESADTLGEFLNRRHSTREIEKQQTEIRAELKRTGKDHLTGNARKKAWAKARKKLFPNAGALAAPKPVRTRNTSTGTKVEYDFYPTRQLLLDEFDAIWNKQAPHHPSMTQDARPAIHHAIFFQRKLKQPPVGKCSFEPATEPFEKDPYGYRCSWAHPLAQRFRIWGEARNLVIVETGNPDQRLTKEQSDNIARLLISNGKGITQKGELAFEKIRTMLGLPPGKSFKNQSEKKDHLKGDLTAAKLSEKKFFGKAWHDFPLEKQCAIVEKLKDEKADDSDVIEWLVAHAGLDHEAASRVITANLPEGHCRLGLRAIKKILERMEKGMNYPDAASDVYGDHAKLPTGELSMNGYLPYYGEWLQDDVVGSGERQDPKEKRWGRFPNPTVHIGLGQLRRVVNTLIAEYGAPAEIAVEMTRDFKLSPKKLAELEKEQADNQRKNERRNEQIQALGQTVNASNRFKLRLWEEQNQYDPMDRRCPYTGEVISIERLMSDETDIDHLIPFADSWDDSAANKIVCMRFANRAKGKQTPFEAFGRNPTINGHRYDWEAISLRAAALPRGKRWRFDPDARDHFGKENGFQARQLNETGWLARVALHYLAAVTNPYNIYVLPGKLTAMIRDKWRLNELLPDHNYNDGGKNRKDHRHHAIDAMVAALTDRKLLHRMSSAYDEERQKIEIPPPWPNLRDDLDAKLKVMTVSHKPDHGGAGKNSTSGALHEDTAYGVVKNPDKEGGANLVYRKSFLALNDKEILRIRDVRLRELVVAHVASEKAAGKDIKAALQSFTERGDISGLPQPVRHVRLTKTENPDYLVSIRDKSGNPYKGYSAGANAFVDILETDGKWVAEAMSVFRANQKNPEPLWRTERMGARFVMRVFKGDMLRIDHEGTTKIVRIVRLSPSNNVLYLVKHNEAGNLQARHDDKDDPFRWIFANFDKLREWNADRVRVDELGRPWRVKPEEAVRGL